MNKNVLEKSFWLMAATALAFNPYTLHADNLPTGGNVTAGLGNISQNGAVMTVQQNTAKMIVDWKGFSIGTDHTVNFVQPSSSSVALNRVTGADPSVIQGHLNANGQVFLINPNGVLFTPTAHVNVGSIITSTLALSDADFLAANYKFEGASSNAIINQGNLVAGKDSASGNIVMIAAKITNEGTMDANGGAIALGAGSKVTLDFGGTVKLSIESGALEALIQNGGAIRSEGGTILLTAQAAEALSHTVIKNTGVIEAQTLSTGPNGEIILKGGNNDRIEVGGTLDASAPNGGDGGFVETSAGQVSLSNDLRVTTATAQGRIGNWLIDPQIIEIYAGTPGTRVDTTYISTSVLNTNLTSTDVNLNASNWIDFTTNFNYTGSRAAILSLYAPVVKLGGNISTTTAKLGLNFGGTYSSTFYNGDLFVYGGSRSIATKGGDVNFYGNIGGGTTNSLTVDTKSGASTPGAITHLGNVNGTFNVTTVTNQILSVTFTAGNKASVLVDCTTATLTVNGVVTTLGSGFIPLGHINFPAGTVVSLNASDRGSDTVTITLLSGGTTTIKPAPNGNITIPVGGLEITKIAYKTKSANAQNLGSNVNVDIYHNTNAGALSNYTAVGGTFTIDASKSVNVAGDIRISAKRFLNNSDASALVAGAGKTWQVWSSNVDPFNVGTGDVRSGLAYNFKQYNATYGATTVLGAGNGFLYTYAPKITFSLVNNLSKVYNASNAATGLTGHYQSSGAVDGDTIGENGGSPLPTTGAYASHNVGTGINVSVTGISADSLLAYNTSVAKPVYGYGLQSTSASGAIGVITKADISAITGITGINKIYNGHTDASLNSSAAVFVGEFAGDDLTLASYTGTFDNKNVGTGKTVNITGLTLGGSDAVNYNLLSTTASTTANITKLTLTDITGITAQDRVYNADVNACLLYTSPSPRD
jgi:filamentous hemagglutinin family protein